MTFYDFPERHSKGVRRTRAVENSFASLRRRRTAAKRLMTAERDKALIWRRVKVAEKRLRTVDVHHPLRDRFHGGKFEDAKPLLSQQRKAAA